MSILKELSALAPKQEVTEEVVDQKYEALLESIEDLYEKWSLFGRSKQAEPEAGEKQVMKDPTKKLSMSRIHTVMMSPSDKSFGLKDKVFGIRNEDPIVAFLLDILGVPKDGSPIRIRTGFMQYDERSKMLFIARFKSDLPGPRRGAGEPQKEE